MHFYAIITRWVISNDWSVSYQMLVDFFIVAYPSLAHNLTIACPMDQPKRILPRSKRLEPELEGATTSEVR